MLISLAVGHLVYVNDFMHTGLAETMSFSDAIVPTMRSFSFMHWICILIGIAACWRGSKVRAANRTDEFEYEARRAPSTQESHLASAK